jgi:hypothetical protein
MMRHESWGGGGVGEQGCVITEVVMQSGFARDEEAWLGLDNPLSAHYLVLASSDELDELF